MGSTKDCNVYKRPFVRRWLHYLFECPTFWRLERVFKCPDCGKRYRCYWDGNDINGKIHVCNKCACSEENQEGERRRGRNY